MNGISIVIPAFNEAENIFQMVSETDRAMRVLGVDFEIIIVDDGSTDNTPRETARARAEFDNVKVVRLPENRGKGNAFKRGFQASSMEVVCSLDADLDVHPYQVGRLKEEMERTGADVVVGSKRHPRSEIIPTSASSTAPSTTC